MQHPQLLIEPDALLLSADVARVCAVTPEAVRKWSRSGRLLSVRTIGGTRLFRGSDVLRLCEARHAQAATR